MDSFNEDNITHMAENGQHYYSPVEMGLIGMGIGWILSLTRFGQWYESSPVIGFIYWAVIKAVQVFAIICCVYFLYLLLIG